ncbi:MAG: site-2 protease family protein [Thaumarchaeota archaeon]|nr:site-2 protease family protein [Nitrososphaerota archaeon]
MEEFKRFEFHFGVILLRTRRFQSLMDRLGQNRISRPIGWFLLYVMPVAAAIGFFLFLTQLSVLLSPRGPAIASYIRTLSPLANLGLPGINPYLPIVDGWIALIVAMVVHEGAHGVVARSLGLPVKASGLLFFLFVPIGAFVDVDEAALKEAKASHSGRVLAAGAGINLVVGLLCLLLLFGMVSSMRPATDGIAVLGVYPDYPAEEVGIQRGDFITAVNGVAIDDPAVVLNSSWYTINNTVSITVWRSGEVHEYNVTIGSLTVNDTRTGQLSQRPFLGVDNLGYAGLRELVSTYSGSFLTRPALYICIPTFPACQGVVPFSDKLSVYYTSSYGSSLVPLATLVYWLFFINFNLAIFNALPIYPLDGGQAFRVGVKALGRGKLSDGTVMKITNAATFGVILLLAAVIGGPYLL